MDGAGEAGFLAAVDDSGTVVVVGEADHLSAPALQRALEQAAARPDAGDVVVDLTGVTFMDSGGINVFARCFKPLDAAGRHLVLIHPRPAVRRALQVSGAAAFLVVR